MAKQLRISGIVQGVGYRAAFEAQARTLHLSGWVRNRIDGSVEALVAGDATSIDKIIEWAQRGPIGARVDHVAVSDADDQLLTLGRFQQLPTS